MRKSLCLLLLIMMIPAFIFNADFSYADKTARADTDYVDNQIIAEFKEDVTKKGAENIVSFCISEEESGNSSGSRTEVQFRITKVETDTNAMLISFNSDIDELAVAQSMTRNPDVESAQPNYIYSSDSKPSSTADRSSDLWYLRYVVAEEANSLISGLEKKGAIPGDVPPVRIAMLDSGAFTDHRDLKNLVNTDKCVSTVYDESEGAAYSIKKYGKPEYSSGTEMAGIAAAVAGGNSKAVEIMAVKVFRNSKSGQSQPVTSSVDIVSGIDYSCRENARIITMGFGHRLNSADGGRNSHGDPILEAKIKRASEKEGVLFVVSAGNGNTDADYYPSDIKGCVSCINTVEYSDTDSDECRNAESNFGSRKNISAPGTGINAPSSADGYAEATGTSCSAAIVASAAALVMYTDSDLDADQVKDILYSTATDLYLPGYDEHTGYGNVNVYRAVAKAAGKKTDRRDILETPAVRAGTGSQYGIRWDKVEKADAYYVFKSSEKNGDYVRTATISPDKNSWVDKDAGEGQTYYYKVSAHGTSGDGQRTDSARSKAVEIKYEK